MLSQEIIRSPSVYAWFTSPWGWVELQERRFGLVIVIHLHDGGLIAAPIAVIRCAEYGNDVLVVTPIVSLHYELVRPRHERQTVPLVKLFAHILTKREARTTGRYPPS